MPEHGKAAWRCRLLLVLAFTLPANAARADDGQPSSNVVAGINAYNRGDIATAYALLKQEAAAIPMRRSISAISTRAGKASP
jgi:hypothetical protein